MWLGESVLPIRFVEMYKSARTANSGTHPYNSARGGFHRHALGLATFDAIVVLTSFSLPPSP